MGAKQKRALVALVFVLAGVAGGVDAIGWLTLSHLFIAHMSGNTVGMTAQLALGDWSEAARRAFAIAAFLVGLALGATAATIAYRHESRASFSLALALEGALLLAFMFAAKAAAHGGHVVPRHPAAVYYLLVVAPAALAMGVQSATLRRVGEAHARTTYVTGVLTRLVENAVRLAALAWDRRHGRGDPDAERTARAKVSTLATVWTSYAGGGVASALLERAVGTYAVLLPVAAIAAAVVVDRRLAKAGVEGAGPEEG